MPAAWGGVVVTAERAFSVGASHILNALPREAQLMPTHICLFLQNFRCFFLVRIIQAAKKKISEI